MEQSFQLQINTGLAQDGEADEVRGINWGGGRIWALFCTAVCTLERPLHIGSGLGLAEPFRLQQQLCHHMQVLHVHSTQMGLRQRSRPHGPAWRITCGCAVVVAAGEAHLPGGQPLPAGTHNGCQHAPQRV